MFVAKDIHHDAVNTEYPPVPIRVLYGLRHCLMPNF